MAILRKAYPKGYEFSQFTLGLDNISNPGELKEASLADCKNFNITRQGKVSKRKGISKLYATACGSGADVNTIYEYKSPGGQYVSNYVLVASGTKIYSYYNSTWNDVKTGLTSGLKFDFVTHLGMCVGVNGTDANLKIYSNGTSPANATVYPLGIPVPAAAPTVSATTLTYARRYLSTETWFRGRYSFVEFSNKLYTTDYNSTANHTSLKATADGTTWSEQYDLAEDDAGWVGGDNTHNFNNKDGLSMASFDSELYWTTYDSTSYFLLVSWDGSTTLTSHHRAFTPDANYNCGAYGLTEFDNKIWYISDWTETVASQQRCVHYIDAGGTVFNINGTNSYGTGNAYLDYGAGSVTEPEDDIRHRTTQLFVWNGNLWLIASVMDAGSSDWSWEVWELNGSYASFDKRYDSDEFADGHAVAGVWASQDATTVYVLGNDLASNGNGQVDCKLYKSTDMYNWEVVSTHEDLGFPFGTVTHNSVTHVHTQIMDGTNVSLVYTFSDDDEDFTLEQTISTNVAAGEAGQLISWENSGGDTQLYLGKYKEVHERPVHERTGTYLYKVCYKRNAWNALIGNPSAASSSIDAVNNTIDVGVTASTQADVDKIVIYRTHDGGSTYYKHSEVANTTATIVDNTADSALSIELVETNTVPPKSKFIVLHLDRMVYLNLPDDSDTGSESKIMWSKAGIPEAVPASNYQFFDRDDGEDITGGASIGDYLVVFKRNKISVLTGDFDESSELYTTEYGVGCIL
jgi:hypothetical protein